MPKPEQVLVQCPNPYCSAQWERSIEDFKPGWVYGYMCHICETIFDAELRDGEVITSLTDRRKEFM